MLDIQAQKPIRKPIIDKPESVRVGVISRCSVHNPRAMSGTPASVFRALAKAGFDIVDLSAYLDTENDLDMRVHAKIARRVSREFKNLKSRLASKKSEYKRTISSAELLSNRAQLEINRHDLDIIIGVCISSMLFRINTSIPMIYVSDTTASSLNTSYPNFIRRSKFYKQACDEIEQAALGKCDYFLPSSHCAAKIGC